MDNDKIICLKNGRMIHVNHKNVNLSLEIVFEIKIST